MPVPSAPEIKTFSMSRNAMPTDLVRTSRRVNIAAFDFMKF